MTDERKLALASDEGRLTVAEIDEAALRTAPNLIADAAYKKAREHFGLLVVNPEPEAEGASHWLTAREVAALAKGYVDAVLDYEEKSAEGYASMEAHNAAIQRIRDTLEYLRPILAAMCRRLPVTTQAPDLTLARQVAEVWTAPCPNYTDEKGEHWPACPSCHGSGVLYPLRLPCPASAEGRGEHTGEACSLCLGTGWVGETRLEVLMDAALVDADIDLTKVKEGVRVWIEGESPRISRQHIAVASTVTEALQGAMLEAAEEARR